jgi:DNA processing protein
LDAWIAERRAADGRPPLSSRTAAGIRVAAVDPRAKTKPITVFGLWTTIPMDPDYPSRLRDLALPPPMINGLGDPTTLSHERTVGVVGTRRPTLAGRALTARICARLVDCGATVLSGLAFGIDGAAHAATLEREGITVGVIGAGHESPGPRAHARLRQEVVDRGGAVISEHHPSTTATKGTYPRRNRIIAALSDALIVVEAPSESGALNTASHALALGRPVFVAPGRVGDWSVAGSLSLLRDTPARPIAGLDELIADLGFFEPRSSTDGVASQGAGQAAALAMLGSAERAVAARVCAGPAGLDLLVAQTGLAPGVVSGAVTLLLMRGWIKAHGPAFVASGPLAS